MGLRPMHKLCRGWWGWRPRPPSWCAVRTSYFCAIASWREINGGAWNAPDNLSLLGLLATGNFSRQGFREPIDQVEQSRRRQAQPENQQKDHGAGQAHRQIAPGHRTLGPG